MGNRDNNGRFTRGVVNEGAAAMSSRPQVAEQGYEGMDMATKSETVKPSRKDELISELKREEEHAALQAEGRTFLRLMGEAYVSQQDQLSNRLHAWFKHQGFWPESWSPEQVQQFQHGWMDSKERVITIPFGEYLRLKKMEKLGLIVTEVAECMEAVRKDDHQNEVEEIADIDIRLHDYKGGFGLAMSKGPFGVSAADGFISKMLQNLSRPFRHGKKF